jgi:CubicO group peptidase (beta-lactamase class C family)
MAKSFTSALIHLAGVPLDAPITRWLGELAERDPRFTRIRVRDLLTMSSGLRYEEKGLPWSDDALTYYGTDLRAVALEDTEVVDPPGRHWLYNNYNPLLLGLILERATGERVADFMSDMLWRDVGAEAPASWSLDSDSSGFEKMESGVNARPRDFARFGLWAMAHAQGTSGAMVPFYGQMWWVAPDGFYARGKFGQIIGVFPELETVVVRLGSDEAGVDWPRYVGEVARLAGG